MKNIHHVQTGYHGDTVDVEITAWDNRAENGVGVLADGTPVTVFTSYDGDGFLVLSDQDGADYERRQAEREWADLAPLNRPRLEDY